MIQQVQFNQNSTADRFKSYRQQVFANPIGNSGMVGCTVRAATEGVNDKAVADGSCVATEWGTYCMIVAPSSDECMCMCKRRHCCTVHRSLHHKGSDLRDSIGIPYLHHSPTVAWVIVAWILHSIVAFNCHPSTEPEVNIDHLLAA